MNPYENLTVASCLRREASWRPYGKGDIYGQDTGSADPSQAKCELGINTCMHFNEKLLCRHLPYMYIKWRGSPPFTLTFIFRTIFKLNFLKPSLFSFGYELSCISSRGCFLVKWPNYFIAEVPWTSPLKPRNQSQYPVQASTAIISCMTWEVESFWGNARSWLHCVLLFHIMYMLLSY